MKRIINIQIKAAILLIVFSLNTIIGFACALGLDMGFNSHHHHDDEATNVAVHTHADRKHHHATAKVDEQEATKNLHKTTDDKDNCCNGNVTKIAQQDKAISQSVSIDNPVFFTALISSFYNNDVLHSHEADSHIKYFVRSHHPPIPDICLAVQSFQI